MNELLAIFFALLSTVVAALYFTVLMVFRVIAVLIFDFLPLFIAGSISMYGLAVFCESHHLHDRITMSVQQGITIGLIFLLYSVIERNFVRKQETYVQPLSVSAEYDVASGEGLDEAGAE